MYMYSTHTHHINNNSNNNIVVTTAVCCERAPFALLCLSDNESNYTVAVCGRCYSTLTFGRRAIRGNIVVIPIPFNFDVFLFD